jgi:hypothetical protein
MKNDGLLRLTALTGTLFGGLTSSETFTYGMTEPLLRLGPRAGPVGGTVPSERHR